MEKLNMRVLLALVFCIAAVQCKGLKRDVSELYSRPAPQEDLSGGGYQYPISRPNYPDYQTDFVQNRPIYPQQPKPVYGAPPIIQQRPIYPQPKPVYGAPPLIQQQPIYPQRPIYPQQPKAVYGAPPIIQSDIYRETKVEAVPSYIPPNINTYSHNIPQQNIETFATSNQNTETSQKIFFPFWNKFQGNYPPNTNYPGSNNVGFPGNYPGYYPNHKFPFFGFNKNYNGQHLETAPSVNINDSSDSIGVNAIGVTTSIGTSSSGYDYPIPNQQKLPLDVPSATPFKNII